MQFFYISRLHSLFSLALKNEKVATDTDISKSEEHPQFSRSLSADDTDDAFRERLKNMGKCNYACIFL